MSADRSSGDSFLAVAVSLHTICGSEESLSKNSLGVTLRYSQMYRNSEKEGSALPEEMLWM
jgi:hypothetical protein